MGLYVSEIYKSLYQTYSDTPIFRNVLPGGLHEGLAPEGTRRPFANFFLISAFPVYNFTSVIETQSYQIDIYADSNVDLLNIVDIVTNVWDKKRLDIVGYNSAIMRRTFYSIGRDGSMDTIHRATLEYELTAHKQGV